MNHQPNTPASLNEAVPAGALADAIRSAEDILERVALSIGRKTTTQDECEWRYSARIAIGGIRWELARSAALAAPGAAIDADCDSCQGTGSGGMGVGCTDCLGTGVDPAGCPAPAAKVTALTDVQIADISANHVSTWKHDGHTFHGFNALPFARAVLKAAAPGAAIDAREQDLIKALASAHAKLIYAGADSARLDWLDVTNERFRMGWGVGCAPAGNVSVKSIIMGGKSIREAIDAAMPTDALASRQEAPVASAQGSPEFLLGWKRYEKARKLSPFQWNRLHIRNLAGENFDAMIDSLPEPTTPVPTPSEALSPATVAQPVAATDAELGAAAYKGFDDYWTEDSPGKERDAWTASAKAVLKLAQPCASQGCGGAVRQALKHAQALTQQLIDIGRAALSKK